MIKYSKSLNDISTIKHDFLINDKSLTESAQRINEEYKKQPVRSNCKICGHKLPLRHDIMNNDIGYIICPKCHHLNGAYSETKEFHEFVYLDSNKNNPNIYIDQYNKRLEAIYNPKAEFLIESLKSIGRTDITVADFGCGSGHLVNSLLHREVHAIGYDISSQSIDTARKAFQALHDTGYEASKLHFRLTASVDDLIHRVEVNSHNVSSFIGVLEHLPCPVRAIESFHKSDSEFIYFSVPLLSLSVVLENIFKDSFSRHLNADHTHLFTDRSIDYLLNSYDIQIVSKWYFGMDSLDLRRLLVLELLKNKVSDNMLNLFQESLFSTNVMNGIQEVIDQSHACSEVHIVGMKSQH